MNTIKTISVAKKLLLISFIFFLSCQKQADVSSPTQKSLSDNAFFSRAKISANQWDLTLTLNNENGLKSLMVPVVDTSNQVKLIIFAYQDTKDHVIFKFVGRNTPQPGLPVTTNSVKTLTKESLVGIFKALDKRVAASKIQLNSSMENIKTNGTYVETTCWTITWHYGDLSIELFNQCSSQIIITPGNARPGSGVGIGVVEDIQIGDSGGGPGGIEEVQEIKNEMKDPCLNTVLSEVTDTKLKSLIAVLFNSTFGGTPGNFTIKFSENPNLLTENGLYPQQARGYYIRSQGIWAIEMNPKFASLSAKESIAAAMIHEIVHSFISLYKEYRGGQASSILTDFQAHTFMYEQWIDKMRDILIEVYGMAPRNAVALSCYGLADILNKEGVPIKEIDDFLFDKYKVHIKDVDEVGELYENGVFGEKCK